MNEERKRRLAKLVKLENRLKAFHETRHAGHLAEANRAGEEAKAIGDRFNDPNSLSALFPEVYHRRIEAALATRENSLGLARLEERKIAAATVRTSRIEEQYRHAVRAVDEQVAAREREELVDRRARSGKPATS